MTLEGERESRPQEPSVPLWPVWRFDSGYSELARYVTPAAILAEPGLKAQLTPQESHLDEEDRDRILAERLYERLRELGLEYDDSTWAAREGTQQVRHPWWLVSGRFGNCVDLSLTYAGMCLAANVGALIAFTRGHVFVVLTPGRLHLKAAADEPLELDGFSTAEGADPGVLRGSGADLHRAIEDGVVEAVDLVAVAHGFDWTEAIADVQRRVGPGEELRLLDVAHLQIAKGFTELPHPVAYRPSIRLRVPSGGGEFKDFGAHAEVIAELREKDGMHVLIGERGRGKSTIARHLAENAKDGAAWFLDASDRKALSNSLAMAMFAEEPRSEQQVLDPPERKAMWETAYAHLREQKGPWLIVLDNADGDPATLRGLIPEPGQGQRLLVTTTNPGWHLAPGFQAHRLPEVEDGDLGRFADGPMADLIEGRPLLLDAFERLAANSSWNGSETPATEADLPAELRGPAAFWSLLQADEGLGEAELRVAAFAAYLPANGQPVAVLEALASRSSDAIERLVERGLLVRDLNAEEVRMHRLFGEAIRLDLEQRRPELCDEVALALVGDEAARAALDEKGDPETVSRLDRRLAAMDADRGVDLDFGKALRRIAGLLELHGSTRASGKTFARAERHLQGHPRLLADCLQGRARTVNQHHKDDRVMLEDAVDWAKEAHAMLLTEAGASEAAAARCYGMQGLLMRALAQFSVEGKTKTELLREALTVLEEADERRQESDEISVEEKMRSTFNLAGTRVDLAQQERHVAAEHLDEAHRIYKTVGDARRELYGRMNHPHIAACENGLGLVGYYRAMLVPAPWEKQTEWLREATEHVVQALKEREIIDGSVDFEEAPKSAALLAKIALARNASPVGAWRDTEGLVSSAKRELTRAGRALESVSLPPNGSGLIAAIDAWARSDALRELVERFDRELPADASLPDLLEWLEDFAAASWNFRKGERDEVAATPQLSLLTEKVIKAAAKALGLVEAGGWRKGRYDQVLILGGKARACLSRPLFAAKLIGKGKFEVGAVTALGGFRELKEDEKALVERVAGTALADEFEAMDTGVRRAFDLGAAGSREGEDSDRLGASWRIHEYETGAGLPVSVVAAPSAEPGERRANTPDTFAWFATEFAKLERGQRLLVVTTDIYLPFQHADALRLLALPYEVEVDTIGMVPGKVDRRLAHNFEPHNYLQEVLSTIRSLRELLAVAPAEGA